MLNFIFLWGFTTFIIFSEPATLMGLLDLVSIPWEARTHVTYLILGHFIISWTCEMWIFKFIVKSIDWLWWSFQSFRRRSEIDDFDQIDSIRWKRRLKWKEKGKIYKLIADDLGLYPINRTLSI